MYGLKKRKIEKSKKNWEIHTETNFFFCFAILALFFVIFAFMQKFNYMYFFVKKGSALQERKVQRYITIGEEFLK